MRRIIILLIAILAGQCLPASIPGNYVEELPIINGMDGIININESEQILRISNLDIQYDTGDGWCETEMCRTVEFGFMSFGVPEIKDGFGLISATLFYFISECWGDNELFVYPRFQMPWGEINPDCLLTHIDYGASLGPYALEAPPLNTPLTMTNSVTLGWNQLDITHLLLDDIEQNRPYSQYKLSLQYISDWDYQDDFVAIRSSNSGQAPYIFAEFAPVTSTTDDYCPMPVHKIKAYPNPMNQQCNINIKTSPDALLDISIYNLRGQMVRNWSARSSQSGDIALVWGAEQDNGNRVPNGFYLIRVSDGIRSQSKKVLKMAQE
jgi:hypothetical protein